MTKCIIGFAAVSAAAIGAVILVQKNSGAVLKFLDKVKNVISAMSSEEDDDEDYYENDLDCEKIANALNSLGNDQEF